MALFRGAPPIDYQRLRADLDAIADQPVVSFDDDDGDAGSGLDGVQGH